MAVKRKSKKKVSASRGRNLTRSIRLRKITARPARLRRGFGAAQQSAKKPKPLSCPIVGIGGSAGGFEATMELLKELPAKNGMAFVIVQHLDPHHASRLASLLGKVTTMPVLEIAETITAEPNMVYVQ